MNYGMLRPLLSFFFIVIADLSYADTKSDEDMFRPPTAEELENAYDTPPGWHTVVSPVEPSVITFGCKENSTDENEVECSFTQKLLQRNRSPWSFSDVAKLSASERRKQAKEFLATCPPKPVITSSINKEMTVRRNIEDRSFDKFCSCLKGKEPENCFNTGLTEFAAIRNKTCHVMVNEYQLKFKKLGPKKWITEPKLRGLCNYVTITMLERRGPNNTWVYTDTRIRGDKGDTCTLTLNKPFEFFESSDLVFPGCDYISLGP